MKKTLLLGTVLFLMFSCQKKSDIPADMTGLTSNRESSGISIMREEPGNGGCVTPVGTPLITYADESGNEVVKGSLTISNDNDFLYVVVSTQDAEVSIASIQLLYGDQSLMNDLSQYSADGMTGLVHPQVTVQPELVETDHTISIPLSTLNTNCLNINVHAVLNAKNEAGEAVKIPVWTLPLGTGTPVMRYPWSANVSYCTQFCALPACGQLRTQSPGGWGAKPSGTNPGNYLYANFASAFPAGLNVGCSPNFNIQLSSPNAVSNFLPSSGKPQVLTMNYADPLGMKNTLAGHLVALTISVQFDAVDENFGAAEIKLGAMKIGNGAFKDWTVTDFLTEANQVLGGCSQQFTIQQVLETAAHINNNYLDGKTDKGYLTCPN